MRVAGYCRVSTQEQATEGYSIPEQQERIQKYCEAKGWELVNIYTDGGYSGAKLDRPAMQQLMAECGKYDMVLVYKLDRLSRSQKDTLYLIEDVFKKNGVAFASMQENFDTSTPFGMAMVGILSVFAQLEREQIRERMQLGKMGKAKDGYWNTNIAPTGYKYIQGTGTLEIDETEAEQVREIFDMYLSGKTIRQIGMYMFSHYSNRNWDNLSYIGNILSNPVYYGGMVWNGEVMQGRQEPIISREMYEQAQTIRMRSRGQNAGKASHLLTGILYCGVCGERMYYHSSFQRGKYHYGYYVCKIAAQRSSQLKDIQKKCNNKQIRDIVIEDAVISAIRKLNVSEIKEPKRKDHSKQIAAINRQIERAAQLYTVEDMDISVVKKMIADLSEKRAALEHEDAPLPPVSAARSALQSFDDILSSDDMNAKMRAIRAIIDRVTVTQGKVEIQFTFK